MKQQIKNRKTFILKCNIMNKNLISICSFYRKLCCKKWKTAKICEVAQVSTKFSLRIPVISPQRKLLEFLIKVITSSDL